MSYTKNKLRQLLYKPGKSKFLDGETAKTIGKAADEIEKALGEGVDALSGKKKDEKKKDE